MITDIEKYKEDFDGALEQLRRLADKVGGGGQFTVSDARILFQASLEGSKFGTKFEIPVQNPKEVIAKDGSIGLIYGETFEEGLIRKWQKKEVSAKDIEAAKNYLRDFELYYSVNRREELAGEFPNNVQFAHFEELVEFVDSVLLEAKEAPMNVESISKMTSTPSEVVVNAKLQWEKGGKSHFQSLFPYAYYFIRVFIIYSLGLTNGVIPSSKRDNAVHDNQYFLYLPFCHVFCSNDRFHEERFKYFQRPEQMFIWGPDFKQDLAQIALYFSNLTPEQKKDNERRRGSYPPPLPNSISGNLWYQVNGPWIEGRFGNRAVDMSEEENKKWVDYVNELIRNSD